MSDLRATAVHPLDDGFRVTFADGRALFVPYSWFPRLAHATEAERTNFYITGIGTGIHWGDLDEDVSVAGLLEGRRSVESPASFAAWKAEREGRPRSHASAG